MKVILQIIIFLFIIAGLAVAGEYGLNVDNSIAGCKLPLDSHLNYCNAERIASDLFRHFKDCKEYEIQASHYGFDRGVLGLKGKEERNIIYSSVESLIALEKPCFENELLNIVKLLPFRSMRTAIINELENDKNSKNGLKRLSIAYKIINENYKD